MALSTTLFFDVTVFSPSDVTLGAVSTQQFTNITPIDLTSHCPSGSRAYCIDMPEGLEVMSKSLRVIGSPVNTQSETNANVYIVPPAADPFWIHIPIEVTASADTVYDNGGSGYTDTSFFSLTEFGTSYTGAGCVVKLAAGANIDNSAVSNSGRFAGLTSPIIIQSIDPTNPATLHSFIFSGPSGTAGNVSLVDIIFDRPQTGSTISPGGALATQAIVGGAGSVSVENVAVIRCQFSSDVAAASTKTLPKGEVAGINTGRPWNRATIWGCTFQNLFNGVLGTGSNFLVARNTMTDCWGDMFRCSPSSVNKTASYVLCCDNFLGNSVSDGLLRHADGFQMGGAGGTGYTITDVERRGDISAESSLAELPAIAPAFWNANLVSASTNQTASSTDDVLYRMATDTAAGNLTVQLPDISTVAVGWERCVQKYSADTSHSVAVLRNGADTINSVGADYVISGPWKAVRFHKGSAGTNWSIQIYGPGQQHGLYQDDGGLDSWTTGLIWACGTISSQFAGHSFEVLTDDVEVEYCTLVRSIFGDIDGDGLTDANDYAALSSYPSIQLRNTSSGVDIVVSNCTAAGIAKDAGAAGTVTQSNNDTGQSASSAAVAARFVGEGARTANRLDTIRGIRHKKSGPLDGTDIGAVWIGVADGAYDFVNMRPRLPGAPTVTTAPVITGSDASGFTISTAAAFSTTLPITYQWLRDGVAISGATNETYSGDSGAANGSKVSLRVTGVASLGDAIADSVNEIEKP